MKDTKFVPLDTIKVIKGDVIAVEVKRTKSKLITIGNNNNDFTVLSMSTIVKLGDGEMVTKSNLQIGDKVMLDGLGSDALSNLIVYATHEGVDEEEIKLEQNEIPKDINTFISNNGIRKTEIEYGIAIVPVYYVVMVMN